MLEASPTLWPRGLSRDLPRPLVAVHHPSSGLVGGGVFDMAGLGVLPLLSPYNGAARLFASPFGAGIFKNTGTDTAFATRLNLPTRSAVYVYHILVWVATCGTNVGNYTAALLINASSQIQRFGIGVNNSGVAGFVRSGGTTQVTAYLPKAEAERRLVSAAVVADYGSSGLGRAKFFVGGNFLGESARLGATGGPSGAAWLVQGMTNASGLEPTLSIIQQAAWAGLSQTEAELLARRISANPKLLWQNPAGRRRRTAPVVSLPTLSLPTYTPGSLTATGFRPRVTAT